jgi:hypothetical protein
MAYEPATAAVSSGCERRRKDDNKIRIGFLSRYKSSKVSFFVHDSVESFWLRQICERLEASAKSSATNDSISQVKPSVVLFNLSHVKLFSVLFVCLRNLVML